MSHDFDVSEDNTLHFEFNVTNLFNQKSGTYIFDRYNQEEIWQSTGVDLSDVDLTQGYDYKAKVLETARGAGSLDPRYGKKAIFNPGINARFSVKYSF